MSAPVLWYVHHHGVGHWRRALAVTRHLARPVVLASTAAPPAALPGNARWLRLPPDAPAVGPGHADAGARGLLHWAPQHQHGLLRRHRLLLAAVAVERPAVGVVDVSVEVTVLLRVSGLPVVGVRLPGDRRDDPHRLGFGLSEAVVMPVPRAWGLHHPDAVPARGDEGARATTVEPVGLVTALDVRPRVPGGHDGQGGPGGLSGLSGLSGPDPDGTVCVIVGRGGTTLDVAACATLARAFPARTVVALGELAPGRSTADRPLPANLRLVGRVDDPTPFLVDARVVVGNTGLGTVADVAAAGRPFVTCPERRPFGEQDTTAQALARTGGAVVVRAGAGTSAWRDAVLHAEREQCMPPPPTGAATMAAAIERAVAGTGPLRRPALEDLDGLDALGGPAVSRARA